MFVRALLLFTATVLLIAAVSSAVSPRELRTGRGAAALSAAAANKTPPPGPGDVRERTLEVPSKKPLVVHVGDIVHVQAAVKADDVVEISDLGMEGTVTPDVPAEFDVIPDRTGRFAVTLRYSGQRIGLLVVKPAS